MTSPPEQITVQCPACAHIYKTYYRASMNLTLDDFDDAYIEQMSTATCPSCGHRVSLDVLVVRGDGVWEFRGR